MEIAQQIDEHRVKEILAGFALPPEIVRVEVTYDTDHSGDPAVFLTFVLRKDVPHSREEIRPLSRFTHQIASAMYKGHIGGYAYTRLKQAA